MPSGVGGFSGLMSKRTLFISCSSRSANSSLLSAEDTFPEIKRSEASRSHSEEVEKRSKSIEQPHFLLRLHSLPTSQAYP